MNKAIIMTEIELRSLIKECVSEVLEQQKPYIITEMAMTLSDYKKKVESLMQQILENWCLIRYVSLTGDKIELKNHWKNELLTHMNNIASSKIKNGDSLSVKMNAIFYLWNKVDWDTDERCISQRLFAKFKKENIPTKGEIFAQIVSDFKNSTKLIAYALVDNSSESILNYIDTI